MGQDQALLSTAYFPPIQYISKFLVYPDIIIEQFENYNKQSYRNRCIILSANGPLGLSVPVRKEIHPKILISQLRIDYDTNWTKIHFKALETAYKHSPFFEFYIDDFRPFFQQKYEFLLPFNAAILELILKRTGLNCNINYSSSWVETPISYIDYRNSIHPKPSRTMKDSCFEQASYYQVFLAKFSFVPNLSILDLLFNEGPNSLSILKKSLKI